MKRPPTGIGLLRRLAGSGWGAGAKTLHISALSLFYSTAEYCTSAWCRSTPTRIIDSILNDALRIVTGCLRPTPTENFSVFVGIQPAELRRLGATLSLANRAIHDPTMYCTDSWLGSRMRTRGDLDQVAHLYLLH